MKLYDGAPRVQTKKPRDSQRAKLYRAEREAFQKTTYDTFVGEGSLEDVKAYVNNCLTHVYWKKHYKLLYVIVEDGRGSPRARAVVLRQALKMPKWSRKPWVILHELAHLVTPRGAAFHGREFAEVYLDLVRHFLGQEAESRLKASFKTHRVKYTKKRELSPERREQLRKLGLQLAASQKQESGGL
jgi:hypothetical protein